MLRLKCSLALLLALVAGASRASAQTDIASAEAQADPTTTLRPGDVVRLRIWREPDLSGDFPVDETGIVVFPKVGPLSVTSEAPDSLKSELVTAYQRYLRNPSVDVTILRRVNILGAVRNPGLHPVDPTMTVADAIALAGGVTPLGSENKIELRRDGERLSAKLASRTRIADSPVRSGDQIYVRERSWISRNPGVITAGISATLSLMIALFIR